MSSTIKNEADTKMANYTKKVNFSVVNTYGCHPTGEDDVYTVKHFMELCGDHSFVDYDGDGNPVKDGMSDISINIKPSRLHEIPEDATHIIWFNR